MKVNVGHLEKTLTGERSQTREDEAGSINTRAGKQGADGKMDQADFYHSLACSLDTHQHTMPM